MGHVHERLAVTYMRYVSSAQTLVEKAMTMVFQSTSASAASFSLSWNATRKDKEESILATIFGAMYSYPLPAHLQEERPTWLFGSEVTAFCDFLSRMTKLML